MLSHLRFHRRGQQSNPSSPGPDLPSPSPISALSSQPSAIDSASPHDGLPLSSSSSALPPLLPPIARVTTDESEIRFEPRSSSPAGGRDRRQSGGVNMAATQRPPVAQKAASRPLSNQTGSGLTGGSALWKYQQALKAQAEAHYAKGPPAHGHANNPSSINASSPNRNFQQRPPQPAPAQSQAQAPPPAPMPIPPPAREAPTRPPPQPMPMPTAAPGPMPGPPTRTTSSFTTPLELRSMNSNVNPPSTGRRPAGLRLHTEPSAPSPTNTSPEQQKSKKSLPFLRNPMSTLLTRRRNNHNVPELTPLQTEEPIAHPGIRGTRVHDFSAPRPRNNTFLSKAASKLPASHSDLAVNQIKPPGPVREARQPTPPGQRPAYEPGPSEPVRPRSSGGELGKTAVAKPSAPQPQPLLPPERPAPPVPPKDLGEPSLKAQGSNASRISVRNSPDVSRASTAARVTRSRNVSLSSVPRHMKSTSSRFSFDMVGSANQEKLLEERHRQREMDKQPSDPDEPRDSRFDDFDDDAFDYDAMMDDDGLEERIPGVNADYEEEDDYIVEEPEEEEIPAPDSATGDPDNDQENFAGFVFQRSGPSSHMTTPRTGGMMATPRDPDGKVIGFAMSKDSPAHGSLPLSPISQVIEKQQQTDTAVSGLGIQEGPGADATVPTTKTADAQGTPGQPEHAQSNTEKPNLDFDDGVPGYEDEFAEELAADLDEYEKEAPFDESLFDIDDTDQYGRPLPGAFAHAQSLRRAAQQQSIKRESDMTSRLSGHSGGSHSTAHTSMSYDTKSIRASAEPKVQPVPGQDSDDARMKKSGSVSGKSKVDAYQAALAAAAQEALASGKFNRSPSLPIDQQKSDEDVSSVKEDGQRDLARDEDGFKDDSDNQDGVFSYDDMDGYDLDDDAIIAEANAEALASDSDGWYGQEFGFYSAPVNGQQGPPNPDVPDFEYANGGFFGPKGMDGVNRSKSGRAISQEPNLTPITEQSEYSNRNSMMSLAMPPFSSSTPIQSPGLAQLAMMAERGGDDQMTLSSLMRLRSKAWGGSQASLIPSREGSPMSDVLTSPWASQSGVFAAGGVSNGMGMPAGAAHARKNSAVSQVSLDSEGGSPSGSPTLTNVTPAFAVSPVDVPVVEGQPVHNFNASHTTVLPTRSRLSQTSTSAHSAEANEPPSSAVSGRSSTEWSRSGNDGGVGSSRRSGMGHRHRGSADSISYMKEEDSGEMRWVMERRRTGETGEVEVLEREVVEGGRI